MDQRRPQWRIRHQLALGRFHGNVCHGRATTPGKSERLFPEHVAMSNASLESALNQAINESKLFSQVVKGNGGDYLLTANIFSVDQPMFGFAMTVKMEAGWILKRASNDKIVWQEAIRSEHTSAPGDAFAGVTRVIPIPGLGEPRDAPGV